MRKVCFAIESWPTKKPFCITGYTFTEARVLHVTIVENHHIGQGEATGVYYLNETAEEMLAQANSIKSALEQGLSREDLQDLLPAGGARNAIDCALWDLEIKLSSKSIWDLTGITPGEIITVNTVGIDTPKTMATEAMHLSTPKIKVKLNGEQSLERIKAVCAARPDAEIIVDVNQGWTFSQLVELAPEFQSLGIAMIEQPLPRGDDQALVTYESPIPLCADESCLDTSELAQAAQRYQMINIKLDKTGGLTEALKLARQAKAQGLELMVGNMLGTSLAMAPGFVIAQLCKFVDLDGALFLKSDRHPAMDYAGGRVSSPSSALWGL